MLYIVTTTINIQS